MTLAGADEEGGGQRHASGDPCRAGSSVADSRRYVDQLFFMLLCVGDFYPIDCLLCAILMFINTIFKIYRSIGFEPLGVDLFVKLSYFKVSALISISK